MSSRIARPAADEYGDYYSSYIDSVPDSDLLDELSRQGRALQERFSELGEERARHRYAPGKWSVKEVLGHLVDCERIMSYRALCFARSERQSLPGFEQDDFVAAADFDSRPLSELLAEYAAVREATVALFAGLSPTELARRGRANDLVFSVRALAYLIAGHERHHLEILAERYGV